MGYFEDQFNEEFDKGTKVVVIKGLPSRWEEEKIIDKFAADYPAQLWVFFPFTSREPDENDKIQEAD